MAPHVQWNVKPTQFPTTTLTSLLASTRVPWFDPLAKESDLSEGSIQKVLQDGRLQTLAKEFTPQTLPPRSGECSECQAFIAYVTPFHDAQTTSYLHPILSRFTNAIGRHVQKLSLVSGIHSLQTRMEVERMDQALLDAENYDALDILRRNPGVMLKICPACGATREHMVGDILDLAPWVDERRM
jgi:hypothetical protein